MLSPDLAIFPSWPFCKVRGILCTGFKLVNCGQMKHSSCQAQRGNAHKGQKKGAYFSGFTTHQKQSKATCSQPLVIPREVGHTLPPEASLGALASFSSIQRDMYIVLFRVWCRSMAPAKFRRRCPSRSHPITHQNFKCIGRVKWSKLPDPKP